MKFTKMHGCGNDYIYVNGFEEKIPFEDKEQIVMALSDRHFGIGGDGVIFINPSSAADFEMEMYNADGSRAEMCGNGIRCVAKYVYDSGLTDKETFTIVSCGKVKHMEIRAKDAEGKAAMIRVNMGSPELIANNIPVVSDNDKVIDEEIFVCGQAYRMTCVSMGNPHAVVFVDEVRNLDLEKIGPEFENHERFPKRINTEFVKIMDEENVEMRVWERGSGETLACGTGCCATLVACVLNGYTKEKITVHVLGGKLEIEWDRKNDCIYMTGPATTVFTGEVPL